MSTEPTTRLNRSVDETAEIIGISRNSAFQAVRKGEIKAVRIGKRWLVPQSEIDRLTGRTTTPA